MNHAAKVSLVVATIAAVGAAGTLVAWAQWPVPGVAEVAARTAKMPRGVTPSVAKVGKKAVVSWSAQRIAPGAPMTAYVVTAHSVDEPARAEVVRTVPATGAAAESVTFTAAEVAGGKWYWTLVPRLHSWAGEVSRRSDRLTFPAARETAAAPDAGTRTPADQAVVAPDAPKPAWAAAPKPSPAGTATQPGVVPPPDPPGETPPTEPESPPESPPAADAGDPSSTTD